MTSHQTLSLESFLRRHEQLTIQVVGDHNGLPVIMIHNDGADPDSLTFLVKSNHLFPSEIQKT